MHYALVLFLLAVVSPVTGGIANAASAYGQEPAPIQYSRTVEIGPVRFNYAELLEAIERVRVLVESANADVLDQYRTEFLRLGDNTVTFEVGPNFSLDDLAGAPQMSSDLWYELRISDAPVSLVRMRFGDFSREITVEGVSQTHVDAVSRSLRGDSTAFETFVGGAGQRRIGGGLLFGLVVAMSALSLMSVPLWLKSIATALNLVFVVSLFVPPWATWFPGTAVFTGESSWLVQNGPLLTLAGVVIGLVALTIVIGGAFFRFVTRSRGDSDGTKR